jgi:hypothetical protein
LFLFNECIATVAFRAPVQVPHQQVAHIRLKVFGPTGFGFDRYVGTKYPPAALVELVSAQSFRQLVFLPIDLLSFRIFLRDRIVDKYSRCLNNKVT